MLRRLTTHSISFKLVGAFILVILLGTLSNAIIIPGAIGIFFNYYLDYTGNNMAKALLPQLSNYYQEKGSWQGVNDVFINQPLLMMDFGAQGPGGRMGPLMGNPTQRIDSRFILLDKDGNVVADNMQNFDSPPLPAEQPTSSYPILVNDDTVGTLCVYHLPSDPHSPGFFFIEASTRIAWITTIITAILAMILGFVILRQIVLPLKLMTTAAQKISLGDLSQRVQVSSNDEIGTLAVTFNQMAETLEQDQIQRRNMTADIAHELRTPISIIQANLEAMLDGVLLASPGEIASLRDESALLARLVDDLRLLSLAEAGQLKLVKTNQPVDELLQKTVELFHSQADDQHITLTLNTDPNLPQIFVDTDRISMVIRNLLNNAFRYTPPGGKVELSACLDPSDVKQIRIEVSDSGCGIEAKDLPYIFNRFYRADASRTRSSGGTGIGLAIVKQLVEAHGGNVTVQSPIYNENGTGFGTRFWFTIKHNGKKLSN